MKKYRHARGSKILNEVCRKLLIAVAITFAFSTTSYAQEQLFSINTTSGGAGKGVVQFSSTDASPIGEGTRVSVPLTDGRVVGGSFYHEYETNPLNFQNLLSHTSTKIISLDDGAGTVDLHLDNAGRITGMTMFETASNSFSRVVLDTSETGVLLAQDPNNYFCADMPVDNTPDLVEISAEETPSLTVVQNLQSNPGANTVLYIDYWGGSITVASEGANIWNATYGSPLNYDPYSYDSNTASFSAADRYRMYHAWLEAAEDYAPFNVNVTTMRSVYDSYATTKRSRIIGTTFATRDAYNICNSGCGGVAYKPSFGNNYYNTGFTFNNAIGSMGMTHSHEAGHQMGLSHDGGAANPNYYSGHGDWGPVMGAPFNKPYVQWSKGEYPGANNTEDDYTIIDGQLGTLPDDVGNTLAFAETIPASGSQQTIYQITPDFANYDPDYFKLELTSESSVQIEVAPRFGVDYSENAAGETNGANLTQRVRLWDTDSSGALNNVLLDEIPVVGDRPNTNIFDYDDTLPAGTYYMLVQRWSPDTSWTTGWQNWGHGGQYQVSTTVTAASYPYIYSPADGSTLLGPNQSFVWTNNGADVDRHFLYIGNTYGGRQYYNSGRQDGNEYEHVLNNLPTNGETIYGRLWSFVNGGVGWVQENYTWTAASAVPAVVAPLPESQLESTLGNTTFYWSDAGVSVTDWHVYIGNAPGQRNYFNSGGLASTVSSVAVTGLPTDGRDLWLRLWYKVSGSWKYVDNRYMANASGSTPTITAPWPGASIGTIQTVYWNANSANADRWRVYAGSSYGASNFTFTSNLPANTRSYDISGWGSAYAGGQVWVRLQWRDATTGLWSRTNEVFVAGNGPSGIVVDDSAPVDP